MTAPPHLDDGCLPTPDQLTAVTRAGVSAAAASDVVLRTLGASALSLALLPVTLDRGWFARDLANLRFYAQLAREQGLADIVPSAPTPPEVTVVKEAPLPLSWRPGSLQVLRTPSRAIPVNPALRVSSARPVRNEMAWAQRWLHADGARPTIIVVHGFGVSPYRFNRFFFALPWFYAQGYDVLLVSLPFHGRRRSSALTVNGIELFSSGVSGLTEGLLQALRDLRGWIDHLLGTGAPRVGITGLSLGGYLSAALACIEPRLSFVIPNAPVVDIPTLLPSWAPAGPLALRALAKHGVGPEDLREGLAIHSPLHHRPVVPQERLLLIAGLGDRLAPPGQTRLLWEHWGRPAVHWFPGNHVVHFQRGVYVRRVAAFLRTIGFRPG